MRRFVAFFAAGALILALAASCTQGPSQTTSERTLLESVPAGMGMLVSVRLSQITTDPDLRELWAAFARLGDSDDDEDMLAGMKEMTGVDPSSIQEAILAAPHRDLLKAAQAGMQGGMGMAGASPPPNDDDTGGLALFQGSFDREAVIAAVTQQTPNGGTPVAYQDGTIYHLTKDGEQAALAFLSDERFALGEEKWVKAALDVQAGKGAPLTGPLADTFSQLGSPLVKLHMEVPAGQPTGTPAAAAPAPGMNFAPLAQMQSASLIIDKSGRNLQFRATQRYADDATAQSAASTTQGAVAMFSMFSQDPTIQAILSRIQVTVEGRNVAASATFTVDEIKQAAGTAVPAGATAGR